MIRRITLTLGMGVAVLVAGIRQAPSQAVAGVTAVHEMTVALHAGPKSTRTTLRSGYIVASS